MEEKWVHISVERANLKAVSVNARIMLNMTAGCAGGSSGSGYEYENKPSCSTDGDYWLVTLNVIYAVIPRHVGVNLPQKLVVRTY
jgi:hypothetical protein